MPCSKLELIKTLFCYFYVSSAFFKLKMDENFELQRDEIEALMSIYEDQIEIVNEESMTLILKIDSNPTKQFHVRVGLPTTYPSKSPPKYEINAPWLKSLERKVLHEKLDKIYDESCGNCILYEWMDYLRNFVDEKNSENNQSFPLENVETSKILPKSLPVPPIFHGEPLVDRRSTFQAHVATVISVSDVKAVRETLLQNRKIANATHNIVAYRISNERKNIVQDCDDDGETAAGRRLLHLLQILDAKNVVVVVSRWYGGILLGPDRFKHINNVARQLLVEQGYVTKKS